MTSPRGDTSTGRGPAPVRPPSNAKDARRRADITRSGAWRTDDQFLIIRTTLLRGTGLDASFGPVFVGGCVEPHPASCCHRAAIAPSGDASQSRYRGATEAASDDGRPRSSTSPVSARRSRSSRLFPCPPGGRMDASSAGLGPSIQRASRRRVCPIGQAAGMSQDDFADSGSSPRGLAAPSRHFSPVHCVAAIALVGSSPHASSTLRDATAAMPRPPFNSRGRARPDRTSSRPGWRDIRRARRRGRSRSLRRPG
jgi:hypothetical protein